MVLIFMARHVYGLFAHRKAIIKTVAIIRKKANSLRQASKVPLRPQNLHGRPPRALAARQPLHPTVRSIVYPTYLNRPHHAPPRASRQSQGVGLPERLLQPLKAKVLHRPGIALLTVLHAIKMMCPEVRYQNEMKNVLYRLQFMG